MRKLRLVGLSADGKAVVCVDEAGVEFSLPADDRLRAALRGDRARLGQLEIEMDSALRPRDIQARIRAGESPDAVATLAQVSVDRIMPYCVPVLAERQHVAETARRSHVRRKNAEGPARRLADVVAERLRGRGVDPETTSWDAWRRDDGRWTVRTTYHSGESERVGTFVFDLTARYSVADDDEARWLTGEKQSTSHGPQPREVGRGERRLTAVPDTDLLSLTDENSDDLTAVIRAVREGEGAPTDADQPATQPPTEAVEPAAAEDAAAEGAVVDGAASDESQQAAAEPSPEREEPRTEPTPRKRRQRRASVPSWDEIMFGKDGSNDA